MPSAWSMCIRWPLAALLLLCVRVCGVQYAPRGWNSYDSFIWSVNETQFRANVDAVAQLLAPHGYESVTIDFYWYLSADGVTTSFDSYGRPQPDAERFPSSRNGAGFKPLADYAHSKGLKFGIHLMRGINGLAAQGKFPVYGVNNVTTDEIIDTTTLCSWSFNQSPFYSVNLSKPGGMEYYLSLYSQYAQWGVDLIKYDCVFGEDFQADQIVAASKSISASGRSMVLSLSPGVGTSAQQIDLVGSYVDMYRITADVWDNFGSIQNEFQSIATLYPYIGAIGQNGTKSFPDLDMMPFGWISDFHQQHWTQLTRGEQRVMFTLQCFTRAPLIYGGDVSNPDLIGLELITNEQMLYVQRYSLHNRPLQSPVAGLKIWAADDAQSGTFFLAFFNVDDVAHAGQVSFQQLNLANICDVVDLIAGVFVGIALTGMNVVLDAHDALAIKLTNCKTFAIPQDDKENEMDSSARISSAKKRIRQESK